MPYRLETLGRAGLTALDGAPAEFPVGKPFGMLVYLALADGSISRESLGGIFWPGVERTRARQSVRQALSLIRKHLGDDVVTGEDPVGVAPGLLVSDVAELEAALDARQVDRVAELYRGPFLGPFQLTASPEWDHWVEARRRVLAERAAAAFHEAARSEPDPEAAVAWARRAIEAEPFHAAHRVALLERLLEQGDLTEAAAELAEAHQADLDRPDTLESLEQRLRELRERRANPAEEERFQFEFVGRAAELAALNGRWRAAAAGRRQIAILHGPTGIGKTRLARELMALAAAGGAETVQVKASRSERRLEWGVAAELGRTLHALPGAAGVSPGSERVLRTLIPSLPAAGPAAEPLGAPGAVALSDALVDLASAVAYEGPLLIVLDDMQWADRSSVAVLLRTIRQLRDEPILVVFTFRSEEVNARAYATAEALARDEDALILRLAPLSPLEVEELLALSGIAEDPAILQSFARRLHQLTRGHPLFLVELVRSLTDQGLLVRHDDGWRFTGPPPQELELPASVRLVIAKRLAQLSEPALRLATALAHLPTPAPLARARARSGLSASEATEALQELLQRDVVSWDDRGGLGFAHDQLRDAVGARRRGRRRIAVLAGLVVVALAIAALARTLVGGADAPYGGGALVFTTGDSVVTVNVRGRDPAGWTVDDPAVWYPHDPTRYSTSRARRLTDGRLVWFGSVQDPVHAPDAVIYTAPGQREVVVDRPGDDVAVAMSPDGSRILAGVENLETPDYDVQIELLEPGADEGLVLGQPASSAYGRWSADGSRIAVRFSRERDDLVLFSPRGDTLLARTYFYIGTVEWCGLDRLLMTVRDRPTGPLRRILLDVRDGGEATLDTAVVQTAVACSPDGTAYLDARLVDGRLVRSLRSIDGTERYPLPVWVEGYRFVQWIPDQAEPEPVALATPSDSLALEWGEELQLPAALHMSDGAIRAADVRWRSEDASIASVLGDGRLSANRPGTTRLIADYRHWLADTMVVRVTGGGSSTPFLADDFRTLDTDRWIPLGFPTVGPVMREGRPALQLLGDGRYRDGMAAREARVSERGTTVELELHMPLTAPERQRFTLCLVSATPPDDLEARHTYTLWNREGQICVSYPAYELQKWSERTILLESRTGQERVVEVPADIDLGRGWTPMAIQLRADGVASLWLDRRRVASIPVRLDFLSRPLRPVILAATVGTEGFIRDFAWWTEPRYR